MRTNTILSPFSASRRRFLTGAMAAAAAAIAPSSSFAKGILEMWPIGVQLWTVNSELQSDPAATLKAVRAAGYQVVETAGTAGRSAAEFRALIEDNGLTCRSAHAAMGDLIHDLPARIDEALSLGATWLVCASPQPLRPAPAGDWVAGMTAVMDRDAWLYNAGHLARIAPLVTQSGLRFAYHNHPMEFRTLSDGSTGYDHVLAATDPQTLRLEMDLGWVLAGGHDPVAMMQAHAARIDLLHIKDMVRDPGRPAGWRSVAVGQGVIDWKAVFAAARTLGVRGYFVEQEAPFATPPLQDLAASRAYIAAL